MKLTGACNARANSATKPFRIIVTSEGNAVQFDVKSRIFTWKRIPRAITGMIANGFIVIHWSRCCQGQIEVIGSGPEISGSSQKLKNLRPKDVHREFRYIPKIINGIDPRPRIRKRDGFYLREAFFFGPQHDQIIIPVYSSLFLFRNTFVFGL